MKKRYWLFIHTEFEFRPGMEDYIADFNSFHEAKEVFQKESENSYEQLVFRVFDSHSGIQLCEDGGVENTKWIP